MTPPSPRVVAVDPVVAGVASEAPRPVLPAFPDGLFIELQAARARGEQQDRMAQRIESLFDLLPPVKIESTAHALPAGASYNPSMSRRGKGTKWYGIRVGRQPGVYSTWAECKARVDGIKEAEFRSFPNQQEAMDWVRTGTRHRKVNFMLTIAKTSFVGGRALRAVVEVLHEGESRTRECKCCLDSGSDVNLAERHFISARCAQN